MKERRGIHYLILVLACLSLYLQCLGFQQIELDDHKHIFENPIMLQPTWAGFGSLWAAPYFGLYIPLTYSVWFLISIFSTHTFYFHALNLVLHTANSCLILNLLRFLNFQRSLCLIGALAFALHPLQVESVSWISATKDLLSSFFALLTLLSILKDRNHFLTGLLFILALISKPSVAFLAPFLFLIPRGVAINLKHPNPRLLWSFLFLAVFFFAITKFLQPDSQVQIIIPLINRPLIALDSITFYLQKTFIPIELLLDYGRNPEKIRALGLTPAHFATLVLLLLTGLQASKNPRFRCGFLFFLFSLLPTSGLIPFQFQIFSTVADHYFYLGIVGVLIMCIDLLECLPSKVQLSTGLVGVFMLWGISNIQVQIWRNNDTLFAHTLKSNPNSFLAHNNWAYSLYHRKLFKEASVHFGRAAELRPNTPEIIRNYGAALIKAGQQAKGATQFRKAERLTKGG